RGARPDWRTVTQRSSGLRQGATGWIRCARSRLVSSVSGVVRVSMEFVREAEGAPIVSGDPPLELRLSTRAANQAAVVGREAADRAARPGLGSLTPGPLPGGEGCQPSLPAQASVEALLALRLVAGGAALAHALRRV